MLKNGANRILHCRWQEGHCRVEGGRGGGYALELEVIYTKVAERDQVPFYKANIYIYIYNYI